MRPLPIDPRAWLLWMTAASIPALVGRNPFPLLATLLVVLGVRAAWRNDDTAGWSRVLRLGAVLALFGVIFNVLTAHIGDLVFARLPESWPIIGGILTVNALIYGLLSGLAILVLLLIGTTMGVVLDWNALLRLLPDRLASVAVASSIAWALVPQTTRAIGEIREAQAARGHRPRGVRDAAPLLMPLLAGSLERSMILAEALEARAFGAPLRDEPPPDRWRMAALAGGLGLATLGAYSIALGHGRTAAITLPVSLATLWFSARSRREDGPRRTRYRTPVWDRRATAIAASAALCLLGQVVTLGAAPWAFAWDPYPSIALPAVHLPLLVLLGLLLVGVRPMSGAILNGVTYAYPDQDRFTLSQVDWSIGDGEFVLLAGPSGSGKSTLLRCLNGLVPHFSGGSFGGTVVVDGYDTRNYPPRALARSVGFVFQDPEAQFVTTRVDDEIAFGMEQLGVPQITMRKRVEEVLDLLGIAALRDREVSTLSGGERQRVAVAAALALHPAILALDEPTSQLDPWGADEVLTALTRLNDDLGLTIVLAEHRLDRVLAYTDRLRLLDRTGALVADAPPREALLSMERGALPPLARLGTDLGWNPLPLTIKEGRAHVAADAAAGRAPGAPPADPSPASGPPVIQVQALTAGFGRRKVLRGVDFEVRPGELVALMGRNGSGKTTLLRALLGLHTPESGRIFVHGRDVLRTRPADLAAGVGYVPQNPTSILFADTLRAELEFTLRHHPAGANPESTLDALGLLHAIDRHPRDLSGGERERAALAAILVGNPRVLLLDEPTRGMDPDARRALAATLERLRRDGVAIVMATHDVELVAATATRVAIIGDGTVIADGGPRAVLSGSLSFATQINKLYGGGFLTPEDVTGRQVEALARFPD